MWRRLGRIFPQSPEHRSAFLLGGLAAAAVASPLFIMAYRTFARSQADLLDSLVGELGAINQAAGCGAVALHPCTW